MYLRDDVFHSSSFKNVSFIRVSGLTLDLCFYPHLFILSALIFSFRSSIHLARVIKFVIVAVMPCRDIHINIGHISLKTVYFLPWSY